MKKVLHISFKLDHITDIRKVPCILPEKVGEDSEKRNLLKFCRRTAPKTFHGHFFLRQSHTPETRITMEKTTVLKMYISPIIKDGDFPWPY